MPGSTSFNIYLTFGGNCREAFEYYRSVFGGDFAAYSTFADAPPDMPVADDEKDLVMHVSLPVGDNLLMGSDTSAFAPPLSVGNNFSIAIAGESRAHCDELFAKLSAGGSITMELQETFWGSYYGLFTDRFGISWMVNYDLAQESEQA
jgi:PhnB protein